MTKSEEEINRIVDELEECSCNPEIDVHIGGLGCLLSDAASTIIELKNEIEKLEKRFL
jgi:hypothetical protein